VKKADRRGVHRCRRPRRPIAYFASGSGRSWKCTI
jgi:hypothetical protein